MTKRLLESMHRNEHELRYGRSFSIGLEEGSATISMKVCHRLLLQSQIIHAKTLTCLQDICRLSIRFLEVIYCRKLRLNGGRFVKYLGVR